MDADEPLPSGAANVVMPRASAGENVVLTRSGWGDGYYPLMATFSGAGQLLGIHIDLLVVGPLDPEGGENPDADHRQENSDTELAQPKGILARIFGRR